ncbi:MAG: hypothetical protein N0E44_22340 [Candidatus Thiodiazotropha lotti]|nr:hypothetical protein [Candidatus Thiodiazotropha lotti]MCW4222611.1 hypothetical protein [Candidatus Thiodiazotropha lotti]
MSNMYCSDSQFNQCIGIKQKECNYHVRSALENCDYRPVWDELERMENSEEEPTFDINVSNEIGECVGKGLQNKLSIPDSLFDQCAAEQFARFRAKIQAEKEGRVGQ